MNPKAIVPLVAGLGIAGFAAKMGIDQIRAARGAASERVQLWTVIETVPRGGQIREELLRPMELPPDAAPSEAVLKKESLVGRVPAVDVTANLPILRTMLYPPGTIPGIQVPEGYRAVAVKIDESSGVDNHLQPGAWVDVVGMFSVRASEGARTENVAKTIIENVQVAAVGQRMTPAGAEEEGNSKTRAKPARAVTLLVQPDQVPVLHLAEQRGKIKLSLRTNTASLADKQEGTQASNRVFDENDLLGKSRQEEEGELGDMLAELMGWTKNTPEPEPAPEPEPELEPEPDPGPQIVWTMTVFNGDDRRVLGWTAENPYDPIELSATGANIFEDDGWDAPRGPRKGKQIRGQGPRTKAPRGTRPRPTRPTPAEPPGEIFQPLDDPNEGNETTPSEPKELFE